MAKRKHEEATAADIITGMSTIPAGDLKKLKSDIQKIAKSRVSGNGCNKAMKKLLSRESAVVDNDDDDELDTADEPALNHKEEEAMARLLGGGSYGTEPTKEESLYRDRDRPDRVIDEDMGDFETIFCFACMKAIKEDYLGDLKERALHSGDKRDEEDLQFIKTWLLKNIRTPLDKLSAVVAKNEDRVALFKQIMCSVSLKFNEPHHDNTYICILSGKELKAEKCTEVILIDDPSLFKPLAKKAKKEHDPTPKTYHIRSSFRNIVYSVFHLRTLIDGIGADCIRWAKKEGILHKAGAMNIPVMFQDSDENLLSLLFKDFKVSKATIEAYCKSK